MSKVVQLHEKEEMELRLKRLFSSIPHSDGLEEEFLPQALKLAGESLLMEKLSSEITSLISKYVRERGLTGIDRSYVLNSVVDIMHAMTIEKTRNPDPAYSPEH